MTGKNRFLPVLLIISAGIITAPDLVNAKSYKGVDLGLLDSPPPSNQLILVSIKHRTLEFFEDGKLKRKYLITVGKKKTPTPIGEGYIRSKGYMVFYNKYGNVIHWSTLTDGRKIRIPYERMLGMGIEIPGAEHFRYYIHATTDEDLISQAASQGCVRMKIKEIAEFYPLVKIGARIIIRPD